MDLYSRVIRSSVCFKGCSVLKLIIQRSLAISCMRIVWRPVIMYESQLAFMSCINKFLSFVTRQKNLQEVKPITLKSEAKRNAKMHYLWVVVVKFHSFRPDFKI